MGDRVLSSIDRDRAAARRSTGARTTAATALALTMLLTACGQKAGVHVEGPAPLAQSAPVAQAPATTSDGAAGGAAGTTAQAAPGPAATSTGSSSPAARTDTNASTSTAPSNGSASTPASSQPSSDGQAASSAPATGTRPVQGTDRTGVTADSIAIGIHAPVTGAAPLPVTSFEKSGDLYWRNLIDRKGGDVLGRTRIDYLFRDDRYDPNSARQVCRELEAETFTFAGGGGTDQIQACGAFAEAAGAPYFSAGVTEAGLRGLDWYFAASMSYKQQGPLLAQLVRKNADTAGKRVAAIITDTPNFDDAVEGWEAGVQQQGLDYYKTLRHPKGDTSWYSAYANDLASNGVEVVFILSSPVDYIRFAQQANQNGLTFQYVGVGVSMGLNAVLNSGCPDVDRGIFLSPFPGLDYARQNVPEFFEAGQEFGVPTDDIALALWGTSKTLHQLLVEYGKAYGTDLTREDFRTMMENASISNGVFPDVSYTPEDHFGARTVHVLQAECSTEPAEYRTLHAFASSF